MGELVGPKPVSRSKKREVAGGGVDRESVDQGQAGAGDVAEGVEEAAAGVEGERGPVDGLVGDGVVGGRPGRGGGRCGSTEKRPMAFSSRL